MDARSLVMGFAAARTVTDDPQTVNQSAILGAVVNRSPILSFAIAQQYARSLAPAPSGLSSSPSPSTGELPATVPAMVTVPDLSSAKDEKEMRALLAAVQLSLAIKREPGIPDARWPGDFISQTPPPDTSVPPNSVVTVTLSKGSQVTLSLDDHTKAKDLIETLLRHGIRVEAVPLYATAGDYRTGDAVRLRPPVGTIVYPGDEVTVEVQEDRRHATMEVAAKK